MILFLSLLNHSVNSKFIFMVKKMKNGESIPAHLEQVKEKNKKLIRNMIRKNPGIAKSLLAKESGLSVPTVTSAIRELEEEGLIIEMEGPSRGGRPGAVYSLNRDYQDIICANLSDDYFFMTVYDYQGNTVGNGRREVSKELSLDELLKLVLECYWECKGAGSDSAASGDSAAGGDSATGSICAVKTIVLGIPGIAVQGVVRHLPIFPRLKGGNLIEKLHGIFDAEIMIENDINAIAISEAHVWRDYAHIIWVHGCIGSAVVLDGRIIHGAHGCAGEVEYVCGREDSCIEQLKKAITAIICVVDVPLIAVSGDEIDSNTVEVLNAYFEELLTLERKPVIEYVEDEQQLYEAGLWKIAEQKLLD